MNRIAAFHFLCRCLAGTAGPEIRAGRVAWERVVEIASEYLMTLALYHALAEQDLLGAIPAELLAYFETMHELNLARNQAILDQAFEAAGMLNRIAVEPLLFKGASHLATGLHADAATRIMHDIDVLVPEDRVAESYACLQAGGYQPVTAVDPRGDAHFHLTGLRRPGGAAEIELHQRSPWPSILTTGALFAGSQTVERGKVRLRVPSATASFMITVAHAYVQHGSQRAGLIPLRDLYDSLVLARSPLDWVAVVTAFENASRMDALRIHGLMLQRLLGGTIPGLSGRPRSVWLYWRLCLLGIRNPVLGEMAARNIAELGWLASPSVYPRKLRHLRQALRPRGKK